MFWTTHGGERFGLFSFCKEGLFSSLASAELTTGSALPELTVYVITLTYPNCVPSVKGTFNLPSHQRLVISKLGHSRLFLSSHSLSSSLSNNWSPVLFSLLSGCWSSCAINPSVGLSLLEGRLNQESAGLRCGTEVGQAGL